MGERTKEIIKIEELEPSIRVFNALKANGINTILDLIEFGVSEEKIKKLRNIGKKSQAEIMSLVDRAKDMVLNGTIYNNKTHREFSKDTKIDDPIDFLKKRGFKTSQITLIYRHFHGNLSSLFLFRYYNQ